MWEGRLTLGLLDSGHGFLDRRTADIIATSISSSLPSTAKMETVRCLSVLMLVTCALEVGVLSRDPRQEKKADVVKKFLKKHKKREGELRLVDGSGDHEGNVEIFHMGRWGAVCDDEWDEREAAVVCRQLGYKKATKHTHSAHFGQIKNKYWMDNVYCSGDEERLDKCRFDPWGTNDCEISEAAGVVCYAPEEAKVTTTTTETPKPKKQRRRIEDVLNQSRLQVRLAGGRIYTEGRVEVKYGDSSWGLVCGDGWSLLEAAVVCRQMGYGFASTALQTDFFGGARSDIVMSGVECQGNEFSMGHCLHDDMETLHCPGDRDNIAAVVCTREMADLVIDADEIERTTHLDDKQMYFLQCAMEENCLASQAYKIQQENPYTWHLETRRLLRFTARILNAGTADFRPSVPKHLWEFHQCHMHYHSMEVFATFDIMDANNVRVAEGHKASFCLEDNECLPGVQPGYVCANFGDQGISVNCSDIYRYNIDCQWIDITDLTPGLYTFKVAVNPEFKVAEQSFDNNAAVCQMFYSESYVSVYDCVVQRP